jgi:hypothetical protein
VSVVYAKTKENNMSRVGEAIRQEQEQQLEQNEQEFNLFERQALLDAIHYAQMREAFAERFKGGDK